jgi:hypothetical protein
MAAQHLRMLVKSLRTSADHGQKRELGGVTITGGLDLTGPIT